MKIKSITFVGKKKVYDVSVEDAEHYFLENGIVTHNTGPYYSADNIFIVGREQDKKDSELLGYKFHINVEKSRFVKEKSKISIDVSFENGINKWSGLLDMALESGHISKATPQLYQLLDPSTGEIKGDRVNKKNMDESFWLPILQDPTFVQWIKDKYTLANGSIVNDTVEVEDDA